MENVKLGRKVTLDEIVDLTPTPVGSRGASSLTAGAVNCRALAQCPGRITPTLLTNKLPDNFNGSFSLTAYRAFLTVDDVVLLLSSV